MRRKMGGFLKTAVGRSLFDLQAEYDHDTMLQMPTYFDLMQIIEKWI